MRRALGIVPAVISPLSCRGLGPSRARELFLTGERFRRAARPIGSAFVHHVVADSELDAAVAERVDQSVPPPRRTGDHQGSDTNRGLSASASVRDYTAETIVRRRASHEGAPGHERLSWRSAAPAGKRNDLHYRSSRIFSNLPNLRMMALFPMIVGGSSPTLTAIGPP